MRSTPSHFDRRGWPRAAHAGGDALVDRRALQHRDGDEEGPCLSYTWSAMDTGTGTKLCVKIKGTETLDRGAGGPWAAGWFMRPW